MITIDITSILSPDLKSRSRANDLMLFVKNSNESEVIIDFSKVMFAIMGFLLCLVFTGGYKYFPTFLNYKIIFQRTAIYNLEPMSCFIPQIVILMVS